MSLDETALRDAIFQRPTDDGARLEYSDWLLARGDPYGEFLSASLRGNQARAATLLPTVAERAAGGLSRRPRFADFRRGFLANVEFSDLARRALDCEGWQLVERLTVAKLPAFKPEGLAQVASRGLLSSLQHFTGIGEGLEALGSLQRPLVSIEVTALSRPLSLGALRGPQTSLAARFGFLELDAGGNTVSLLIDWHTAPPAAPELAPLLASFIRPTDAIQLQTVDGAEVFRDQVLLALQRVPHASVGPRPEMIKR